MSINRIAQFDSNENGRNFRVFVIVDNFKTDCDELEFGDFLIKTIRPGSEAAAWRKRMHCKHVPRHILIKDFNNYISKEDDISGFDNIMNTIENLLLSFRLFRTGDFFFNDMLIQDLESDEESFSRYRMDNTSAHKYILEKQHIDSFIKFRNSIIPKIESNLGSKI